MTRRPAQPHISTSVRLRPEARDAIEREAERRGRGLTDALHQLIERGAAVVGDAGSAPPRTAA